MLAWIRLPTVIARMEIFLYLILFYVGWIVLMRWVLPRFGVKT